MIVQGDLIVANITIATLLELHPTLATHVSAAGRAILSGVLAERVHELVSALEEAGWKHERTEQELSAQLSRLNLPWVIASCRHSR